MQLVYTYMIFEFAVLYVNGGLEGIRMALSQAELAGFHGGRCRWGNGGNFERPMCE